MFAAIPLILLQAAASQPLWYEELPPSPRGPHAVHADFNGDGQVDTARLLFNREANVVALWVILDERRGFPVSIWRADARSRGMVLRTVFGGDHTCPQKGEKRTCGRGYIVRHYPSILVEDAEGSQTAWSWNNYVFMREEVYE